MDTNKLRETMDVIITNTFIRLETVYNNHKEGFNSKLPLPTGNESRLVFPAYFKNGEKKGTRISEQELRFAFVEQFNYYCEEKKLNFYYSIETPTKDTYSGFTDKPIIDHEKGRSAEFDLVIYNQDLERVCLIEFKANNAKKTDHEKDFLKLNNKAEGGGNVLRYFIEVIKSYSEREDGKQCTISTLKEKLNTTELKVRIKNECKIDLGNDTQIWCYALEGESGKNNSGEDISRKFKNTSTDEQ